MGYFLRDVAEKRAAILEAVPDAVLESWQDYGFRLTAVRADGADMTVMRPGRPEYGGDDAEINRSVDAVVLFLRGG